VGSLVKTITGSGRKRSHILIHAVSRAVAQDGWLRTQITENPPAIFDAVNQLAIANLPMPSGDGNVCERIRHLIHIAGPSQSVADLANVNKMMAKEVDKR
jgi:hypothetical protein